MKMPPLPQEEGEKPEIKMTLDELKKRLTLVKDPGQQKQDTALVEVVEIDPEDYEEFGIEEETDEKVKEVVAELYSALMSEDVSTSGSVLRKAEEQNIDINSEAFTSTLEKALKMQMENGYIENVLKIMEQVNLYKINLDLSGEKLTEAVKNGLHKVLTAGRNMAADAIKKFAKENNIGLDDKKLKKIYRQGTLKCHPDKVIPEQEEDAKEVFKLLQEAYENLDFYSIETIMDYLEENPFTMR